jgi:energy-coupling factor transport system permease protein
MEKFDPRARWLFSFLFLFSVTFFWDFRFLLFFFIVAFGWYFSARTKWRETKAGWRLILFMLSMLVIVNTIITSGSTSGIVPAEGQHTLFTFNWTVPLTGWEIGFRLTIERVWFALLQVIRITSISAVFLIIPYSMDPRLYGFSFRGLGLPDRFAYSMDLAFRYVPTLGRDFSDTLDAQKARGYEIERVEGGLITQVRRVAPLIVPVTMNSIVGGEDIANAMDLRCFGVRERTWISKTEMHWYDYAIIAFGVVLLLGSILSRYVFGLGSFWVPPWILPG